MPRPIFVRRVVIAGTLASLGPARQPDGNRAARTGDRHSLDPRQGKRYGFHVGREIATFGRYDPKESLMKPLRLAVILAALMAVGVTAADAKIALNKIAMNKIAMNGQSLSGQTQDMAIGTRVIGIELRTQ
jgi:hypothetical protein